MKRLTSWTKSTIADALNNLLIRLDNYLPFPQPFDQEAGTALLRDSSPPRLREIVAELTKWRERQLYGLTLQTNYYHDICVGPFLSLRVNVAGPTMRRVLLVDHPRYNEIHEWLENKRENRTRYTAALKTVNDVIEKATTAGQIIRVLPFLQTYLPEKVAQQLADRERASRRPRGCDVTDTDIDYLHTSLAFAQLLPEERGVRGVFDYLD